MSDVSMTARICRTGWMSCARSPSRICAAFTEPREALLQLRDKIDLLGEQSFEKKTQGAKGLAGKRGHKAYLALLKESLEGSRRST